jgi:ArsR family transcriptional regulator
MATVFTDVPDADTAPHYEIPANVRRNVVSFSKMLSDPTRLRIMYYLTNEPELNVSQICERVAQSQPAVSHHLAMMRTAGLVQPRRDGRQIFYSVRNERVRRTMEQMFLAFALID